jgi:hypothetical protein
LLFEGDHAGHDGGGAEAINVAAEDAGEERATEGAGDFFAEVSAEEVGDADVGRVISGEGAKFGGAGGFVEVGLAGSVVEQRIVEDGGLAGGDHHAHSVGEREQVAVAQQVGAANSVVRRDEVFAEAEFDGELAGPGLFGDPSVGTTFDGEGAAGGGDNFRLDDSAEARGGFKQREANGGAVALGERELVGRGETADATSDDDDVFHFACSCDCERRARPCCERSARAEMRSGDVFSEGVRWTVRSISLPRSRKAMSMS